MKQHLPVGFWEDLFQKIKENNLRPDAVRKSLEIPTSTFYLKKRQFDSGGIQPRKPGSGRPKVYHSQDYAPMISGILRDLPPVSGHRRIWLAMKKRGVPFCRATAYRIMKELGLTVPQRRGKCRKQYKPIKVDRPGEVWIADTTTWWMGRHRVEIYLCLDAYSRWLPHIMVSMDRTSRSTLRYYDQLFRGAQPDRLHTDNGTEFANRNALSYLHEREIGWKHGPSHTPQAQGLVERLVKTLKEEWLMWKDPNDTIELQSSLVEFQRWYNQMREHSALNYQFPEEVYHASK